MRAAARSTEFLEFFFPRLHDEIDWSRPPQWLDKEFQAIVPAQEGSRRIVDKLARVFLLDGKEQWILIHVEVQGQPEQDFNWRMLRYNVLIRIRYEREAVSLAVLTDETRSFRPGRYLERRAGQKLLFRFPVVKILDYERRREELEASRNPFALVVLAHLEARGVESPEKRFEVRFALARKLYSRGFGREDVQRLYRFLEWILGLPAELEMELKQRIETEIEGKAAMPFLATYERIAMEKGREEGKEEGLREAVRLGLELRFGDAGLGLFPRVSETKDVGRLRRLIELLRTAEKLDDLKAFLETA